MAFSELSPRLPGDFKAKKRSKSILRLRMRDSTNRFALDLRPYLVTSSLMDSKPLSDQQRRRSPGTCSIKEGGVVEAAVRPHVRLRPNGRATSDPSQGWPSGRSRTRTLKPNPNTEP